MRVVRSTTFEVAVGVWEKIEVELDETDLLPEEEAAAIHVRPQLLENRIDKHIVMTMLRRGHLTKDEAAEQIQELDAIRSTLIRVRPKAVLKQRGMRNE